MKLPLRFYARYIAYGKAEEQTPPAPPPVQFGYSHPGRGAQGESSN